MSKNNRQPDQSHAQELVRPDARYWFVRTNYTYWSGRTHATGLRELIARIGSAAGRPATRTGRTHWSDTRTHWSDRWSLTSRTPLVRLLARAGTATGRTHWSDYSHAPEQLLVACHWSDTRTHWSDRWSLTGRTLLVEPDRFARHWSDTRTLLVEPDRSRATGGA